jgi:hypothetical protein
MNLLKGCGHRLRTVLDLGERVSEEPGYIKGGKTLDELLKKVSVP